MLQMKKPGACTGLFLSRLKSLPQHWKSVAFGIWLKLHAAQPSLRPASSCGRALAATCCRASQPGFLHPPGLGITTVGLACLENGARYVVADQPGQGGGGFEQR